MVTAHGGSVTMSHWFRNLSITAKATILLSLTAIFFLMALSGVICMFARNDLQLAITAVFFCFLSAVFASSCISRILLKPLYRLTEHIQNVGKKQGQERFLPVSTQDEIGRLATVFNELLQELDDDAAAQEEASEVFRIVTEFTRSVIVWQLENGDIRYISPNCKEQFGHLDAEFYAEPALLGSLIHPDDRLLWDSHQSNNCGIAGSGLDIRWRTSDDALRYFRYFCQPVFDKAGNPNGIRSSFMDVTAQKQAEQRMTELFNQVERGKSEWEQTLDHLQDFIILTDPEHRIQRYNRILADMSNLNVNQLVGRDWRELLQEVGFSFSNFRGFSGELLHLRSARTYDISVYPIKNTDKMLQGFVISLNDTTELRSTTHELETALADLNEAQSQIYQQEKMASIGQLAAGVAHEINNPMGFITSNLGSLDKYVSRLSEFIGVVDQAMQQCNVPELMAPVQETRKRLKIDRILDDAHQLIAESQEGAGRVRRIVQDLKSFSRVDQAETALIDLNEALETTINIAWNELKYVADLKRELGDIPKVKCFPQQLNQVFLNLLVNAAHALGETRGQITVRTEQDDESVLVKISDTGCGMPDDVQKRIFEPFFTTKEVGKGTGLGLSISYDIIKKHGGSIEVESEVGRGTTFTVRLPVEGHEVPS
jgi:two-component system, NtrC family, sensor kinase